MSEKSIEKRLHELRQIAGQYAQAKATQQYLDHFRKSKLAILMKQFAAQGFKTTAAQEREARATPEYITLLEGLRDATREAERLYWELQIARTGAELWRTQQSNLRAERKAYNA